MRGLTLVVCLLLAVSLEARFIMHKWNCNFRNMFGVHLNVKKMLGEANVNNDNILTLNEDRAIYNNYDIIRRDGRVTLTEFVQRMVNDFCYPKGPASELFLLFDVNKDGVLSAADTDMNPNLFDAQGNADLSVATEGLIRADRLAQSNDIRKKNIANMIIQTYDH
ncbi:hypothetical protein LOTGIDRAFT_227797 [Lottia gigantea]|uniref:EF-hand domain-containing protein n=1 Tax=Lottia gigantea TaxID=225164 RepID=V4CRG8_LOTGI|nr:hypothetical protein LOTGIDRAFT_227797 [Lottia gigantea]ESP05100.1 hypothetical protein LOTGIDRAFT_227797 [Lottia gigantea]